jgi:general secretion pathway protein A
MYQSFYKLRGKPFQLTPDPALLFPSKSHKRAMSYLLYGFEQGEGFVMITGAVGTGKTLLIQALSQKLANRNIAIASVASANLDGPGVLQAAAAAFRLPYEGRSSEALHQDLKWHLVSLQARHTHALLIVDEAQMLTIEALETLRILSNLELNGRALLQVFLIGQSELRRTIVNNHMEQLRQRIIASHRLEPLGEEEARAYILHRLGSVGWAGDPELPQDIFSDIQRASRGIPRKINLIMDRLLLYGYLEELHVLDRAAVVTVLREMQDEMTDMPTTLETPAGVNMARVEAATSAEISERENQLMALEHKLNDILKQLREKIRLKEALQGSAPRRSSERSSISEARLAPSKQEGK